MARHPYHPGDFQSWERQKHKICLNCGRLCLAKKDSFKYCSDRCKQQAWRKRDEIIKNWKRPQTYTEVSSYRDLVLQHWRESKKQGKEKKMKLLGFIWHQLGKKMKDLDSSQDQITP